MPIYPPRSSATKKREILERRVFEFLQLRNLDLNHEKHLEKAEVVRSAKLNYLKVRLSLAKTYSSEFETDIELINRLNKEITLCKAFSYEEIIEFSLKFSR